MSFVLDTLLLAGVAEGLAREASRYEIQNVSISLPRESCKVGIEESDIQPPFFNLVCLVREAEGFPLHHSQGSNAWDNVLESEINAANSGTQGNMINMLHYFPIEKTPRSLSLQRAGVQWRSFEFFCT